MKDCPNSVIFHLDQGCRRGGMELPFFDGTHWDANVPFSKLCRPEINYYIIPYTDMKVANILSDKKSELLKNERFSESILRHFLIKFWTWRNIQTYTEKFSSIDISR